MQNAFSILFLIYFAYFSGPRNADEISEILKKAGGMKTRDD